MKGKAVFSMIKLLFPVAQDVLHLDIIFYDADALFYSASDGSGEPFRSGWKTAIFGFIS